MLPTEWSWVLQKLRRNNLPWVIWIYSPQLLPQSGVTTP